MSFDDMPQLSDRLKYLRAHYGLSQAELAEKAGTTQQAIQQAEKGKARQPRYLHRLAYELDIPIDWLIFGRKEEVVETQAGKIKEAKTGGFHEQSTEILDQFFAMPETDQKLIYELMKARQKQEDDPPQDE